MKSMDFGLSYETVSKEEINFPPYDYDIRDREWVKEVNSNSKNCKSWASMMKAGKKRR